MKNKVMTAEEAVKNKDLLKYVKETKIKLKKC